jgi:hypothetical protein
MLTVLFVYANTTLTVHTPTAIQLVPLGGGATITCTPSGGTATLTIARGTYKIISDPRPTFTGPDAAGLAATGKDERPDPTLMEHLAQSSPGVTEAAFQSFLVVPGIRVTSVA